MSIVKRLRAGRTGTYMAQVVYSAGFKVLAVSLSLLTVPLLLEFAGSELYGIYITLNAIMAWVMFFDLGIGNGLRNAVAFSLAQNDFDQAKKHISESYTTLSIVLFAFLIVATASIPFLNFQDILNTTISEFDLKWSVFLMLLFVMLKFILSLIEQIYHARQKSHVSTINQLLINLLTLLFVLAAGKFIDASLPVLITIAGVSLILPGVIITLLFIKNHPALRPKLSSKHFKLKSDVGQSSIKFFIIQSAALVLLTSDKIISTQLIGPESTTQYDIASKIFSPAVIISQLALTPLWSAYSSAFATNDHNWIRITFIRSHLIILLVVVLSSILWVFSDPILHVWVPNIHLDPTLLHAFLAYTIIRVWADIYAFYLNGTNNLSLQMWIAIFQAVLNIPLSIFLGRLYGVAGIVMGTSVTLLFSLVTLMFYASYIVFSPRTDRQHANK